MKTNSAPSTPPAASLRTGIDAARLGLLLNELRLPAIKAMWPQFAEEADKEGWPAARFLAAIIEHELAERDRRRIERHLTEARLLPGKTLDTFAFDAVTMISKAQVMAVNAGDSWLEKGANLLLFGPPGGGKSHLASAIGLTSLLIDAPRPSNRQDLLRTTTSAAVMTTAATQDSHPDCRAPLTQIVALHCLPPRHLSRCAPAPCSRRSRPGPRRSRRSPSR